MNTGKRQAHKVYADERRGWLDQHEGGQPLTTLAKQTGRNIRTIKKQVQLAADERERALARTELYRQAITQHNASMLGVLRSLRELTIFLDEQFTGLAHFPELSALTGAANLLPTDGKRPSPQLTEDDQRILELTREHLSRDKELWRGLDAWYDLLGQYAQACYDLGAKVGKQAKRLGLPLVYSGKQVPGVYEGFVRWPCRLALEHEESGVEVDLKPLHVRGHDLHYDGSLLVRSDPAQAAAAQVMFRDLIRTLSKEDLVGRIVALRRELRDTRVPLKRTLGDIQLMGAISGRCSVCRRLGF